MFCMQVKPDHVTPSPLSSPKKKWQKTLPSLPFMGIRLPSLLPFAQNRLTERDDHFDATRPDDALSDIFDALSGTNASAAECNPMEVDPKGPEADLPDASDPLISAATNAGTEERHNGTSAAISDGLAFQPPPSIEVVQEALDAIKKLLKPPRVTGGGYKASGLDDLLRERLLEMKQLLWVYIDPNS